MLITVSNHVRMTAYTCSVRVHLPRPLFRRLMARAILERTDLSTIVIRAVRSEMPSEGKGPRGGARALDKGPRAV
jgi:hypothetical protein